MVTLPIDHLAAFFGPQHGFLGQTQDNMVEWQSYSHPQLRIPVHSLYGEQREPTPEMLRNLDAIVVDLQDVGARYYTFIWTLYLVMQACRRSGIVVVVLDRPNPINGLTSEAHCPIQRTLHSSACIRFLLDTAALSLSWHSSFAKKRFQTWPWKFYRCATGIARCGSIKQVCAG